MRYKQGKENIVVDALYQIYVLISSSSAKMPKFENDKDMCAYDADFPNI